MVTAEHREPAGVSRALLSLAARSYPPPVAAHMFALIRHVLWRLELRKLRRHCTSLASDFERTTFLREYSGALIPIGRPDDRNRRLWQSVDFDSFDASVFYPLFRTCTVAAECGVTSLFYIKLLQAFGFRAYQYSFGFTKAPYENFVHTVALVEIAWEDARRLIVQDPYFNLTYRSQTGEPMDFFDLLSTVKRRQYERIVTDSSPVETFLLVPDRSLYDPHLSEECREAMTAGLRQEDGSLGTRMGITRSYEYLMQSPCSGAEKAYVDVLCRHGHDEPFLYTYTLRASDLAGDSGRSALQRKIDAILA
jgi:hypothetical protein